MKRVLIVLLLPCVVGLVTVLASAAPDASTGDSSTSSQPSCKWSVAGPITGIYKGAALQPLEIRLVPADAGGGGTSTCRTLLDGARYMRSGDAFHIDVERADPGTPEIDGRVTMRLTNVPADLPERKLDWELSDTEGNKLGTLAATGVAALSVVADETGNPRLDISYRDAHLDTLHSRVSTNGIAVVTQAPQIDANGHHPAENNANFAGTQVQELGEWARAHLPSPLDPFECDRPTSDLGCAVIREQCDLQSTSKADCLKRSPEAWLRWAAPTATLPDCSAKQDPTSPAKWFCEYTMALCEKETTKECTELDKRAKGAKTSQDSREIADLKKSLADNVQERIDEFRLARSRWRVRAVSWQGTQFGEYGDGSGQDASTKGEYWNDVEGRSPELRKINFATLQATTAPLVVEVLIARSEHPGAVVPSATHCRQGRTARELAPADRQRAIRGVW